MKFQKQTLINRVFEVHGNMEDDAYALIALGEELRDKGHRILELMQTVKELKVSILEPKDETEIEETGTDRLPEAKIPQMFNGGPTVRPLPGEEREKGNGKGKAAAAT